VDTQEKPKSEKVQIPDDVDRWSCHIKRNKSGDYRIVIAQDDIDNISLYEAYQTIGEWLQVPKLLHAIRLNLDMLDSPFWPVWWNLEETHDEGETLRTLSATLLEQPENPVLIVPSIWKWLKPLLHALPDMQRSLYDERNPIVAVSLKGISKMWKPI
jgi:hypothetical protein